MSEVKASRTVEEIRLEYSQTAAKAGHLHYQITELSKDLVLMTNLMRDLNFEATQVPPAAPEAPKS